MPLPLTHPMCRLYSSSSSSRVLLLSPFGKFQSVDKFQEDKKNIVLQIEFRKYVEDEIFFTCQLFS